MTKTTLVCIERCELRTGSGVRELWRKVTPISTVKRQRKNKPLKVNFSPVNPGKCTARFFRYIEGHLKNGGR